MVRGFGGGGTSALHSGGLTRTEPQPSVLAREPSAITHHVEPPRTLTVLARQDQPGPSLQTVKLRLREGTGRTQGHAAESGLEPQLSG